MKVKFRVDTGFAGCTHEVIEEVDDDMTDSELEAYAQEIACLTCRRNKSRSPK